MPEITEIRCSACGSNDATKIGIGKYKCNYCESKFDVQSEFVEDKIKRDDERQKTEDEKNVKNNKAIKRFVIIGVAFFVSFFGAIVYLCFTDPNAQWNERTVVEYKCFWGTNGPVIFKLLEQKHSVTDSIRYFIKTTDPLTDQLQEDIQIGTTIHKSNSAAFLNTIDLNFAVVNDVGYVFSKDSGIIGFSIYSYSQMQTANDFKRKFPQLKVGITEAIFYPDSKAFTLTTSDGKDYFYYPEDSSLVLTPQDGGAQTNSPELQTNLFLTIDKKPQLVEVEYDVDLLDDDLRVIGDRVDNFKKHSKEYKDDYGMYSVEKLGNKAFYRAKVIERYNGGLLILYAKSHANTSEIILELVDDKGNMLWQNNNDLLQNLKNESSSEDLSCDYSIFENNLALSINAPKHQTIAIDIKTGKTLWVYPTQNKNLKK